MQVNIINLFQNISEETVNVFKEQLKKGLEPTNYDIINCISQLIKEEDNAKMERMPVEKEVKKVVFSL